MALALRRRQGTATAKNTIRALVVVSTLAVVTSGVLVALLLKAKHSSVLSDAACLVPESDPVDWPALTKETQAKLLTEQFADKTGGFILLEGLPSTNRKGTDTEVLFRQESHILWLTGVNEPDIMFGLDTTTSESILFIPRYDEKHAVWNGRIRSPDEWKEQYGPNHVLYTDQVLEELANRSPSTLYTLPDLVLNGTDPYNPDTRFLGAALSDARTTRTPLEVKAMRYAIAVGSAIHDYAMAAVTPQLSEGDIESLFRFESGLCGMRHQAYLPIVGGGTNGAILHYNTNAEAFSAGGLLLLDAGPEWHGYSVDITRTYPVNGKFTPDQALIYNIVKDSADAVIDAMAPGIDWLEMNALSRDVIAQGLLDAGFLKGSLDDIRANEITRVFYPHSLGHLMGIDVHDTDHPTPTGPLEPGMVITVEPGIYFNEPPIAAILDNPADFRNNYLVADRIRDFFSFGGVRIEDDILVTADGIELLSMSPRSVEDIEALVSSRL